MLDGIYLIWLAWLGENGWTWKMGGQALVSLALAAGEHASDAAWVTDNPGCNRGGNHSII